MLDFALKSKLRVAISSKNCEMVKNILSNISVIDAAVKGDLGLLLHHEAITVQIAKELLSYGADVRRFNGLRDTPLHSAIDNHKEPEFIELLLKYGASTDSSDRRGNTPLYTALKGKNRNLEIIKLLLEYGADINILNRERRVYGDHYSSLEYSMFDLPSIKLLVKYTLLKNFNRDYKRIINLDSLKEHNNYLPVLMYFNDCVSELSQLNMHMVTDTNSLYELMIGELSTTMLFKCIGNFSEQIYVTLRNNSYPIYQDAILESAVTRISFLYKLRNLNFYFKSNVPMKKIILGPDSVDIITKYLSNTDLLHLLMASYKSSNPIP